MTKAFVIAEHESEARELCAGARLHAEEVALCVVGKLAITGISDTCIHIAVPDNRIAEDAFLSVNEAFDEESAQIVFAENSQAGLALAGRLAAHLGTAIITSPLSIEENEAKCMYYGGAGVRTVHSSGPVTMYAFSKGAFDPVEAKGGDSVREMVFIDPPAAVQKIGEEELPKTDVDLHAAEVVVGCGSGFACKEELQLARDLAEKVGAEIGCTRPLAEAMGWFPKEAYIGVTGETLSLKTYIGVGVSGQMQHMIGVNTADTVIAINKDKNAPIFRQCDYGFVGDLKDVLPALSAAL